MGAAEKWEEDYLARLVWNQTLEPPEPAPKMPPASGELGSGWFSTFKTFCSSVFKAAYAQQ